MAAQSSFRHRDKDLPRFWITLPAPVQRQALADPLLSGLFPSHVGFFPRASGHRIERALGIPSTIFNYCVKGSGWCTVAGVRHEVRSGDLMVVPAGEAHAYGTNPDDAWTLHWFHAMGTNVLYFLEHLGVDAREPVVHLGRDRDLEALFVEVRETLEDDYSGERLLYAAQALAYLMGVMIRLRRREPGTVPKTERPAARRVMASLEHMKRHLAASHSVDELAALADLSASHYSELVHRATGYPPKEYLARLRMHRAAQLLDTTGLAVKVIAREVGFSDPLHFSRVFRRINERSPRQYRAQARERDR